MSRIVSSSEASQMEPPKIKRYRPKVLHMAVWIHAISLAVTILLGWIDIIPGHGSVSNRIRMNRIPCLKFDENHWFFFS